MEHLNLKSWKWLIMLIALFTYSSICRADDAEGVLIWQTDGSCTTCQMDAKPVITYSGDSLLLTAENVDVKLPLEGIVNITFGNVATSISSSSVSVQGSIKATSDDVLLSDFKLGTPVFLYSVNGVLEDRYTIPEAGSLQISLVGKRSGMYIIKAGRSTIKIVRK